MVLKVRSEPSTSQSNCIRPRRPSKPQNEQAILRKEDRPMISASTRAPRNGPRCKRTATPCPSPPVAPPNREALLPQISRCLQYSPRGNPNGQSLVQGRAWTLKKLHTHAPTRNMQPYTRSRSRCALDDVLFGPVSQVPLSTAHCWAPRVIPGYTRPVHFTSDCRLRRISQPKCKIRCQVKPPDQCRTSTYLHQGGCYAEAQSGHCGVYCLSITLGAGMLVWPFCENQSHLYMYTGR